MAKEKALRVFQEFPKWKYRRRFDGEDRSEREEEKALGRDGNNTPNERRRRKRAESHQGIEENVKPWWEEWKWIILALADIGCWADKDSFEVRSMGAN